MFKGLLKSKTFWASIVQFLIAFTAWVAGDITLWMLALDFVGMLGIVFYRDSIDLNLRRFFNQFEWFKSKTVWTLVVGILGFIGAFLAGEMQLTTMLIAIVTALIGVFLRSAQNEE